jgi:glyceraldehyde 3-phosphate dehydrogenase (phosphorylating)
MPGSKKIKVAINGFGRIGRMTLRVLLKRESVEVVAINDLGDPATLAHLFKYDSIHGRFDGTVSPYPGGLEINGRKIPAYAIKDATALPWKTHEVDVVLECTGKYLSAELAKVHLQSGAGKVLLSAPSKGKDDVRTIVLGVNEAMLDKSDRIISNASCTTNNAAPMLKILDDRWGIESAFVTTVHSYTGDQNIHDGPHKDLRRARAAAVSIIPTTTGAAKALGEVLPNLKGKIGGAGIRVPVPDGSLTDITCILREKVTVEEVNGLFKAEAEGARRGILEYTEDPIVSVDIIGNSHSCIFDAQLTTVIGNMVKIVGWYDNETGYSNRLADLTERLF